MLPYVFVFLIIAIQAGITVWLWRDEVYLKSEKIAQTKLIWLLPLLGAVMVGSMLLDEAKHQKNERKK
jgi:tellurite resistance protein TehA-like permease